jgi:hypothetical protein
MEAVNLLIKIAVHNAYTFDLKRFGGPDRDRTDDLFHAMEARSQLRHRPTFRDTTLLLSLLYLDSSNQGHRLSGR